MGVFGNRIIRKIELGGFVSWDGERGRMWIEEEVCWVGYGWWKWHVESI